MRLALQTVICWCVFTTVLLLVNGAKEDCNSSLKNRFRVWLQSRMRRDLGSKTSDAPTVPQQRGDRDHDTQRHSRCKRTTCRLPTCIFPDLIKKLHEFTLYKDKAPQDKVGCKGYGRRRRSLRLAPETGRPSSRWSDRASPGGHYTPPTLD